MEDNSPAGLIDKVSLFDIEKVKYIPVTCFNKRTNKTTQLVNNIDPTNFLKGRNKWYCFEFESPVFVKEIKVFCEGYSSLNNGELKVEFNDSNVVKKTKNTDGIYIFSVGSFIDRFSFRPEKSI